MVYCINVTLSGLDLRIQTIMISNTDYIPCFSCGARCLNLEGDCHAYMLASPGCWAMFCEIMEREYTHVNYAKAHQFTVDAYAAQHVGMREDQRAVNSLHIHLASLHALFALGLPLHEAPTLRTQFSAYFKKKPPLSWLSPPANFGEYTVYELWENEDDQLHYDLSRRWAQSVWEAWSHQHEKIASLLLQCGIIR